MAYLPKYDAWWQPVVFIRGVFTYSRPTYLLWVLIIFLVNSSFLIICKKWVEAQNEFYPNELTRQLRHLSDTIWVCHIVVGTVYYPNSDFIKCPGIFLTLLLIKLGHQSELDHFGNLSTIQLYHFWTKKTFFWPFAYLYNLNARIRLSCIMIIVSCPLHYFYRSNVEDFSYKIPHVS